MALLASLCPSKPLSLYIVFCNQLRVKHFATAAWSLKLFEVLLNALNVSRPYSEAAHGEVLWITVTSCVLLFDFVLVLLVRFCFYFCANNRNDASNCLMLVAITKIL